MPPDPSPNSSRRVQRTPLLDEFLAELNLALSEFGSKAELARHLYELYGGEELSWRSRLSRFLNHHIGSLHAEHILAIQEWIRTRAPHR